MTNQIYSALYGGSDSLKPLPEGVSGIVYTDDVTLQGQGWEVRCEPMVQLGVPRMAAKYWKLHPHIACPDADVTLWLDASMQATPIVTSLFDKIGTADAALFVHPDRDCVYDELDGTYRWRHWIYEGQPLARQVEHYHALGMPEHWGLYASGSMVRMNGAALLMNAMWWEECSRWSVQDQLSLPFVLWRLRERVIVTPIMESIYDNPWFSIEPHAADNPT